MAALTTANVPERVQALVDLRVQEDDARVGAPGPAKEDAVCRLLRGVVGGSGKAEQIRFLPELLVRVIARSFLVVSHPQAHAISRAQ